jgi:GR25 family glycosyltransferase involved in LPS biosynthesis
MVGSLCVITIGNVSESLILEITSLFQNEVGLIEIPFTYAETHPDWIKWNGREQKNFGGIGAGAAGCLLGHRAAWEKLINSEFQYALIIESDAEITNFGLRNLGTVIDDFKNSDWNILHLGTHEKIGRILSVKNILNLSIRVIGKEIVEKVYLQLRRPRYAPRQFPFSTHAYLIKKEVAEFINGTEINFMVPIDVILNSYSQVAKNKVLRCRTPLITQQSDSPSDTRRLGR